jgi:hypothetical protein
LMAVGWMELSKLCWSLHSLRIRLNMIGDFLFLMVDARV